MNEGTNRLLLIFDLDDTLYEEETFVLSGFKAVASMARSRWQLDPKETENTLKTLLKTQGRGTIFDTWLKQNGLYSQQAVKTCVQCYRSHKPDIRLNSAAQLLLPQLPKPLYLVTDGNKQVQANKVKALGIEHYFKKILITHRYGIKHAKPSIYCFDRIRQLEKCQWPDMMYIGDNPNKDFINLNRQGAVTVRLLTGMFKNLKVPQTADAKHTLKDLKELPALLATLGHQV